MLSRSMVVILVEALSSFVYIDVGEEVCFFSLAASARVVK